MVVSTDHDLIFGPVHAFHEGNVLVVAPGHGSYLHVSSLEPTRRMITTPTADAWCCAPQGLFTNPERNAFRQPMYRVRFRQRDIWEGYSGRPDDTLDMEICADPPFKRCQF